MIYRNDDILYTEFQNETEKKIISNSAEGALSIRMYGY